MDDDKLRGRIARLLAEEIERNELGLCWLSFANETGFLGVVILEAYGFTDALIRCREIGLNLDGEVKCFQVDPAEYPEALRNRLLKKSDLAGFGVSTKTGADL